MITQPTFVLANSTYQPVDNQLLVIQPKPAPQYVLRSQPQTTTVLTERDIMTMPTLIMYDNDTQTITKNYSITQPVCKYFFIYLTIIKRLPTTKIFTDDKTFRDN